VPDRQNAGDIRRRDDDYKWFFMRIGVGVEIIFGKPVLVPFGLSLARIVDFI